MPYTTIAQHEYEQAVDEAAGWLLNQKEVLDADGVEASRRAVYENAEEAARENGWFREHNQFGPRAYGAIIEFSKANPEDYTDWYSVSESQNPEKTVRLIAFCCFEADIIQHAEERGLGGSG